MHGKRICEHCQRVFARDSGWCPRCGEEILITITCYEFMVAMKEFGWWYESESEAREEEAGDVLADADFAGVS